jgi:NADP-dependent 3-hydroxy acid dehydrogenase YdfG
MFAWISATVFTAFMAIAFASLTLVYAFWESARLPVLIGLSELKRLVDTAVEKYGRIDVMINNAGQMLLSPLEALKVDEWDQMIDINIKGMLYGIAAALPYMKAQKSGHIINVSSVAGHITDKETSAGVQEMYQGHAIPADSFARAVLFAMSQPDDVDINEILYRPTNQES